MAAPTPSKPLYVIADWDVYFETYESARLKGAGSWVAVPTKHDGKSFRRLMREKDGAALYGAWALTVQIAKKMPLRGVLADGDGPLDACDIEDKTFASAKVVERMLEVVSSERIGWVQVLRDAADVSAKMAEVRGKLLEKPARKSGAPAETRVNGHSPADSRHSPADCGDSRRFPQVPVDSRSDAGENAPHARARADRTGQDNTGQDRTIPPTVPQGGQQSDSLGALEDTAAFLCGLFGRKKSRLGREAEADLARWSADGLLPLSPEQKKRLADFHAAPPDEKNFTLKARPDSAEGWAKHLMALLDRAKKWAGENGGGAVQVSAPAPAGWREWFAKKWPGMAVPEVWEGLPDYVRDEARRELL